MPKQKQKAYQCIRCGYETASKFNIKRHFYNTQKLCATTLNDIELTEDIKLHIVDYRRYCIPKKKDVTVQNVNILNNFVNQMVFSDKLDYLLEYQHKKLLGFNDSLELFFDKRIKRLEDDNFKAPYVLREDNLVQLVDSVTKIESDKLDKLNILFDKNLKRFKIRPIWQVVLAWNAATSPAVISASRAEPSAV